MDNESVAKIVMSVLLAFLSGLAYVGFKTLIGSTHEKWIRSQKPYCIEDALLQAKKCWAPVEVPAPEEER